MKLSNESFKKIIITKYHKEYVGYYVFKVPHRAFRIFSI